MKDDTAAAPEPQSQGASRRLWFKRFGYVLLAGLLFLAGIGVGRGSIGFTTNPHFSSVNTGLPANLDYSSVEQVYDSLRENYSGKLTNSQVLNGLKNGLAESTNDPYTEYFTAKQAKQFDNELNNTFSGIGAELGKNSQQQLIVVSPIKGYPAEKAGLQSGDIITAINGKSAAGLSVDEAVAKIRGKAGTNVDLRIVRGQDTKNLTIVRQNIQVPSVTSKILSGNIGYIQITSFSDDTAQLMDKAADKLANSHVNGIVLDLRGNPGGLLSAAVATASQWLPENKLILQEKRGSTVVDSYNSSGEHRLVGIPTVVLINSGSASAAEITAGALHDNKAAYLIGQKSFGKGVVQQIINFGDGSELKVTVASWYRPDGQNINHKGITPDKTVKLSQSDVKAGHDPQQAAALDYLHQHKK